MHVRCGSTPRGDLGEKKDIDKDKEFDAFISFSHKDQHLVIPELIDRDIDKGLSAIQRFEITISHQAWIFWIEAIPKAVYPLQIHNKLSTVLVLSNYRKLREMCKNRFSPRATNQTKFSACFVAS
ncbi:hypothetical protein CEXT_170971 [Caerostris extrusa]|uniref:TIR domain-containing protein n=1 Tax=Caerostris extrusa TaxID=172846 RepID=A0AAV4XVT6_CAEEX|nr:hypothetical protein CEXT_170971 [Caerostris extrusa]